MWHVMQAHQAANAEREAEKRPFHSPDSRNGNGTKKAMEQGHGARTALARD